VVVIGDALKTNAALTELECVEYGALVDRLMDDGGVLSLWDNQTGDAGAAAIAEALKTNGALTKLECAECCPVWRLAVR